MATRKTKPGAGGKDDGGGKLALGASLAANALQAFGSAKLTKAIEALTGDLEAAQKALAVVTRERDTLKRSAESQAARTRALEAEVLALKSKPSSPKSPGTGR